MSIDIIQIFLDSFKSYFINNKEWLNSIMPPVIISVIAGNLLVFTHLYYDKPLITLLDFNGLSIFELVILTLYNIISIVVAAVFYINLYRYGVLKQGGNAKWNFPPAMLIIRTLSYMLPLYIFAFGVYLIATVLLNGTLLNIQSITINKILGSIFIIAGVYVFTRSFLILLLVAIGNGTPLKTSWTLMKGNVFSTLLLFILSFLSVTVIAMPGLILIDYFGGFTWVLSSYYIALPVFGLFLGTLYLMFLIIISNALSMVYIQLSQKKPRLD